MTCDAMLELMSAALDGEVTAEEQAQLDRHLAQCTHCRALFDELSAIHGACAHLEVAPPPELREAILGQLPPQEPPAKQSPAKVIFLHWQRWAAMAAAFVLISVAAWRLPQTFSGPPPAVKTAQVETIQDRQDAEAPAEDSATGVQFTSGDGSAPAAPAPDPSALMTDTDNDEIALASVPLEGTAAPQADTESAGTKFKGYGGNVSPADAASGQDSKAAVEDSANIASTQVTGAKKSMLYSSARLGSLGGGSSLPVDQADAAAPDVAALPAAGEANDLLPESPMTNGFALQKVDADTEVVELHPEIAPEENVAATLFTTDCQLPPASERCGVLTLEGSASLMDRQPLLVVDGRGTVYELPSAAFHALIQELEAGGVPFTLDESNSSPTAETGLVWILSPN